MTLSEVKEILRSNSILFQECEFANEADFINHIFPFAYTKGTKEQKYYALIIHSNNEKMHLILQFEEKNGDFVFFDLYFGDFCFEYFWWDSINCASLVEEIQEIMNGNHTIIVVSNPKTKQWLSDSCFDRNDIDDDMFGEIGFQKAMKRIRQKKTFWEKLFGFNRNYEIYDWNTYECITK